MEDRNLDIKINELKKLLKTRSEERKNVLYQYFEGNFSNAIVLIKRLILIS